MGLAVLRRGRMDCMISGQRKPMNARETKGDRGSSPPRWFSWWSGGGAGLREQWPRTTKWKPISDFRKPWGNWMANWKSQLTLFFWGWWRGEICCWWRWWGENHSEPQIYVAACEYWGTFYSHIEFIVRLDHQNSSHRTVRRQGGWFSPHISHVKGWGGGGEGWK